MNLTRVITTLIALILLLLPVKAYASSLFTKHIINPVLTSSSSSWDNSSVRDPNVVFSNGLFRMWYTGEGNGKIQIGFATSTNGFTWNKVAENPVLPVSSNNPQELETANPKVIYEDNLYKMWYTTTSDKYYISYATSDDGITWNKHGAVNLPKQQWEGGSRTYPFVLKIGNEYRMWYTANDGKWKISYATSPDGINWTPYANNPILELDTDNAAASVLYDGSTYEMYFHGSGCISYATSSDGINWIFPADKNPAICPSGGWDLHEITPHALKLENGTTLLYFAGLQNGWSIGLATDGLIEIGTPTPTPSPTQSPTPTPSPTLAPTPTPSPPVTIPTTKVVVIPGLAGSYNAQALTQCDASVVNGWGSWALSDILYGNLFESLRQSGYTVLPFYYDWRKSPLETAPKLKHFIDEHTVPNEKVYIVGHSMGGLIARAYIETEQVNAKVGKLMTVGTPHQGLSDAYDAWSGGDLSVFTPIMKTGALLIKSACNLRADGLSNKLLFQKYIPSISSFLPTYPYLIDKKTKNFINLQTMFAKNTWLLEDSSFQHPYYGIPVGTLSGIKHKTTSSIRVHQASKKDIDQGLWLDGKPDTRYKSSSGDGLVLNSSSTLAQTNNQFIAGDHGSIISSNEGIQRILGFLGPISAVRLPQSVIHDVNTEDLLSFISTNGDFTLQDGSSVRKSQHGFLTIASPKDAHYTIEFVNKNAKGKFFVIQAGESSNGVSQYSTEMVSRNPKKLKYSSERVSTTLE